MRRAAWRLWTVAGILAFPVGAQTGDAASGGADIELSLPEAVERALRDNPILIDARLRRGVERFVVGTPLNLDGSAGRQAERSRDFADRLKEATGLPVVLWDERFTSLSAEKTLIEAGVRRKKRRGAIDRMAAAIMLQSYLDSRNRQF